MIAVDPGRRARLCDEDDLRAETRRRRRRVAEGDAVFSPRLAGFVLDAFRAGGPGGGRPDLDQLTPREREVLRLIARGYRYKEIAHALTSREDGRDPRLGVLRKLQLSNRHELTRWAAERRMI